MSHSTPVHLPPAWHPRPVPRALRQGRDTRSQGLKDQDLPAIYHQLADRLAVVMAEAPEATWPELVDLAWPLARARARRAS